MTHVRNAAVLAAACAVAISAAIGPASPSEAAPRTHQTDLSIDSPERVTVNQAYERVPWTISGPAAGRLAYADINLENARTRDSVDVDFFQGKLSGRFKVYDWDFKPGSQKVWIEDAEDGNFNPLSATPDFITIKFGSRTTLATSRRGTKVTLAAKFQRWNATWDEWRAFRKATVRFQRDTKAGWTTIGHRTLDSRGTASATFSRARAAKYRALVLQTNGVWGSKSGARRR